MPQSKGKGETKQTQTQPVPGYPDEEAEDILEEDGMRKNAQNCNHEYDIYLYIRYILYNTSYMSSNIVLLFSI